MRTLTYVAMSAAVAAGMSLAAPARAEPDARTTCLQTAPYPDFPKVIEACADALSKSEASDPDRLPILLQLGEAQHWAGSYRGAALTFGEALKISPQNVRALVGHAFALMAFGEAAGAQHDLEAALALDASNSRVLLGLANNYSSLQRKLGNEKPDLKRQIALWEGVPSGGPDFYKARMSIALTYSDDLGRPDKALEELDRILAAGPDALAKVPYVRSNGQTLTGNYVIQVRKERIPVLIALFRYEDAIAETKELIAQYPENTDLINYRFILQTREHEYPGALADMRKLDEQGASFLVRLGDRLQVLLYTKNYAELLDISSRISAVPSKFSRQDVAVALFMGGYAKRDLHDPAGAKRDVLQSIGIYPDMALGVLQHAFARGYYDRMVTELKNFSEKERNAVEACMVDPGC